MADGSIIARGTGNDEYHQTAPHGAGRVMSRRQAHTTSIWTSSPSDGGIYSDPYLGVRDEAPIAYKDADAILSAIQPTAEVSSTRRRP